MSFELKETIRKRINHPNFLSELVGMVAFNSNKIQEDFFEKITNSALIFRKILDEKNLIKKVNYNPKKFWNFDEFNILSYNWVSKNGFSYIKSCTKASDAKIILYLDYYLDCLSTMMPIEI